MEKLFSHKTSFKFWRTMILFWTILLFFLIIFGFFTNNAYSNIISPTAAIYVVVLSIFSADKEFERWSNHYKGHHPGESYVIIWTALIFGIILMNLILKKSYQIPPEVSAQIIIEFYDKSLRLRKEKCGIIGRYSEVMKEKNGK